MIRIDGPMVGVCVPIIFKDLHLDPNQAQRVNNFYLVVLAAVSLTSGRLGDGLGRRKLFVIGVVLLMAGAS